VDLSALDYRVVLLGNLRLGFLDCVVARIVRVDTFTVLRLQRVGMALLCPHGDADGGVSGANWISLFTHPLFCEPQWLNVIPTESRI